MKGAIIIILLSFLLITACGNETEIYPSQLCDFTGTGTVLCNDPQAVRDIIQAGGIDDNFIAALQIADDKKCLALEAADINFILMTGYVKTNDLENAAGRKANLQIIKASVSTVYGTLYNYYMPGFNTTCALYLPGGYLYKK